MYFILSLKIMVTLMIVVWCGVQIGNFVWDYNLKLIPTWFKLTLGLCAMSMFVSMFVVVMLGIWGF